MSMFFGSDTCNWCEKKVWECQCGKMQNLPGIKIGSYSDELNVGTGDIIGSDVDNNGNLINGAYVREAEGHNVMVQYLDGRQDGAIVKWHGKFLKMSHAVGEFD